MTLKIGFVLVVVVLMVVGLVFEVARPDMILFSVLTLFLLTGVLTPELALQGFSNEGMLTIALLFIIAGAIRKSGFFDRLISRVLKSDRKPKWNLFKMMVPLSGLSAFVNNTPIVVTFTPIIRKWCEDHQLSPSKFLIPLSYCTILGGMITLMGTSTNLVVHGWLTDREYQGFSLFQLAIVGIPAAIVGLIYIATIGYKLLPNYKALSETFDENAREYLAEMAVEPHYAYLNQSIERAGLRNLQGLFLIEIIRGDERISPVNSTTQIQSGDRLIFTGMVSTIAELQKIKGLRLESDSDLSLDTLESKNSQLVETVVSHQSSLLYSKLKDTQFRGKYDAAVIAVHRNNERIKSKIGDITLKPGDTLLLLAGADFMKRHSQYNDFYVVTPLDTTLVSEQEAKSETRKGWIAVSTLLVMILMVTFQVLSMFKAMALAVIILLVTKVITPEEAKKNVQFNILLLIASALGIGTALDKTGAASWVASGLVQIGQPLGIVALLFIIYILTNIFTETITNSAAAAMMIPIAVSTAEQVDVDPTAFAVIVAIAASAAFITPIGYQTNLIVYGPGRYRFVDYAKIGTPLNLIVMIMAVTIVYFYWVQ
ncbi:SLC13 family permease [Tuberibacillus sp. Marseille-P3662]|uniref:SLC13 family permease n=1 Tax=Tuberibacillus sp. Marseille-P3662 TaxID=1965358 RepID=UPI000A1C859D|nr:SLC13 family permease [Tuberibacillus sp. Marseille-P3662]